jgi:hypothetical protein
MKTSEQTKALVQRKLANDPEGQNVILSLLARIFRDEADGHRQSLSGKPVIIAYLLELIDDLRGTSPPAAAGERTE